MLGTRRSNLSRPKRTPMKNVSEDDATLDGSVIPLFYTPSNKYICYFDNTKVNGLSNLKNISSGITSATSLNTSLNTFSYESSIEYDGDESTSLQSSKLQLIPAASKSLTQIAAEKIKEGRYSYRMNECDQSKSSISTVTTKSCSTTTSSSSSSSSTSQSYAKLPSTVLKYMFKCDGGKVGEKIVSNDSTHVVTSNRGSTIQDPCDTSIGTMKTMSTVSSRSRRSKKLQARRSQIVDATFKGSSVSTDVVPSKQQQMKKEPITIVASTVRGCGGFMIPIDEMNDLRPFDEENGVELQLVEDHAYYLSKIDNEIMQHQRRVERELRKSRRTRHRSGMSSSSGSSCSSLSPTPSQADF
jgi:hypothetical protein